MAYLVWLLRTKEMTTWKSWIDKDRDNEFSLRINQIGDNGFFATIWDKKNKRNACKHVFLADKIKEYMKKRSTGDPFCMYSHCRHLGALEEKKKRRKEVEREGKKKRGRGEKDEDEEEDEDEGLPPTDENSIIWTRNGVRYYTVTYDARELSSESMNSFVEFCESTNSRKNLGEARRYKHTEMSIAYREDNGSIVGYCIYNHNVFDEPHGETNLSERQLRRFYLGTEIIESFDEFDDDTTQKEYMLSTMEIILDMRDQRYGEPFDSVLDVPKQFKDLCVKRITRCLKSTNKSLDNMFIEKLVGETCTFSYQGTKKFYDNHVLEPRFFPAIIPGPHEAHAYISTLCKNPQEKSSEITGNLIKHVKRLLLIKRMSNQFKYNDCRCSFIASNEKMAKKFQKYGFKEIVSQVEHPNYIQFSMVTGNLLLVV
jgi:hypothetical protein